MKKISSVLLVVCILCTMLLVGCTNDKADEYDWPKELDDKGVYALHKWVLDGKTVNMDFTVKLDNTAFTQYKLNDTGFDIAEENVESSLFSSSTTALTVGDARQMLNIVESWIRDSRAELATDYNLSLLLPRFAFIGGDQAADDIETYVYSVSADSITALEGDYTGSEEYGSLGIMHQYPPANILSSAQEGTYTNYAVSITVYIDK